MPVLADLAPELDLVEGDGPTLIDSDVSVSDAEQDWDGGGLIVRGMTPNDIVDLLDGGQITLDIFDVIYGGQVIGSWLRSPDGDFVVRFNANATNSAVEAVIESLQFDAPGDAPDDYRMLTIDLFDGALNTANVGSAMFPQVGADDPFNGMVFDSTARVALGDLDKDGDLDAIVSVYGDGFHVLRNNGTAQAADFADEGSASISVGNAAGLTLMDYDGDGWLDLIVGGYDGTLKLFLGDFAENFVEQTGVDNPFAGIDVYGGASPGLADLDGDGFLDIVVADGGGRFDYFAGSAGGFIQQTGANNPLDSFRSYGGMQSVSFADVDGDGDLDFIAGNGEFSASLYVNTGTAGAPSFSPTTSSFYTDDISLGSQPVFADIDADGDLDVVIGYSDGTVQVHLQGLASPSIEIYVEGEDDVATVVDDTPTGAADGPIQANLLSNDSDVDTTLMIVMAEIDGQPVVIDGPTDLADGTRFTINSDGEVTLEPGAAATGLGAAGSGATNTSLTYVITYTLMGGETGTATFTVSGVDDADLLDGTTGDDIILAGIGADIVNGLDGDDQLSGQDGADRLFGGLGADDLVGGAGADMLDGGVGADVMAGGSGDDLYIVDDTSDIVTELGSEGIDRVRASVFHALTAQVENLQLIGSANIDGFGNSLANQIDGNSGDNALNGLAGNDLIRGAAGADELRGDAGNDQLLGGDGEDSLFGGNDNDILQGGADNDLLEGGAGVDSLDGGAGDDDLDGGAGNDRLLGGDGDDFLSGGANNDTLIGGAGTDVLGGGEGDDTYIVDDLSDTLVEAPLAGNDIVKSTVTWTLADNFERLILDGSGDIDGTGNGEANQITGNSGANTLDGGFGNDVLSGGLGNDVLIGGHGSDVMTGGGGFDVFVIQGVSVGRSSQGSIIETDTISDFVIGEDFIDLLAIDAIASTTEFNDAFTIVSAFNGNAGQMVLNFSGGITTVALDVDGDAKADYRLRINGDVRAEAENWFL
jgi:Ca2+-binding RTX toxin-like protein